jgi:putative PIN family toxin of toxin-antitoxin system
MKVVIDTNIFVSSLFNAGGMPRKVIDLWKTGEMTLCVTKEILEEYINVLKRFNFIEKRDLKELLDLFSKRMNIIFIVSTPHLSIIKNDPGDDKFIECAVSADAQYIISGDKHLKALKTYKNIKIISPVEFLERCL